MKDLLARLSELFSELRRRRVFRVAAVYCVVAWLVIQVAATVFPILLLPAWMLRAVVVLAVLGFPLALVLAWAFDLGPGGLRRTDAGEGPATLGQGVVSPAVRAAFVVLVVLVTVGSGWGAWRLWLQPRASGPGGAGSVTAEALDPATVAVLYFGARSAGEELDYVAAGLTESLIHELSQIEALDVISPNGVRPFRETDIPVDSLAQLLGAGSLVDGTVERYEDRLVATVQLTDGASGKTLMSERIEGSGNDLLGLRDEIVGRAARLLGQQLGRQLQAPETRPGTRSAEAWKLVQEAHHLREDADTLRWSLGDVESASETLAAADSLLAEAESADPEWAEPPIQRGWIASTRARFRAQARSRYDEALLRKGIAHAERALELDPGSPAALELRGNLRYDLTYLADSAEVARLWTGAESDLRAAVDADSSRARAWVGLADLLRSRGRFSEASIAAQHALEADPFLINAEQEILFTLAHVWLELEDLDRAARWADEGRRRYPAVSGFAAEKLLILAGGRGAAGGEPGGSDRRDGPPGSGERETAWDLLRTIERGLGLPRWLHGELMVAAALAHGGHGDSARAVIRRVREELPDDPWADYYEANARIALGETREALSLLERYLEALPHRRDYIARDWWWRPLRSEPRFRELVEPGE